jgi:hypothetical protein
MRSPRLLALLVVAATAGGLAACAPEPGEPTPSSTPRPSVSASESASPTAPSTPTPTATASADEIALPATCEDIYSDTMLASLNSKAPPLNDPGVTLHSSQNAELLEVLSSGIPTIRCTWGAPSEFGLATNVSIVDAAQADAVLATLNSSGFGCAEQSGGTICRIEQKTITQDDQEVTFGETHFVRGNGWVSTAWINFAPEGYTEDIVASLWG